MLIHKSKHKLYALAVAIFSLMIFGSSMVATAATEKQLCEDSGGKWVTKYQGSTLETFCECPEGRSVIDGKCRDFKQFMCIDSGGEWVRQGSSTPPTYNCVCPKNTNLISSTGECANESGATGWVDNIAGDCTVGPGKKDGSCITRDIQIAINILSMGVGIIITIMIIIGGIQYMLSRDNPQAIQAAKSKIYNAVLALVSFVLLYAFLQWVVPGGIF